MLYYRFLEYSVYKSQFKMIIIMLAFASKNITSQCSQYVYVKMCIEENNQKEPIQVKKKGLLKKYYLFHKQTFHHNAIFFHFMN